MSDELNESHEATGESAPVPATGEPASSPVPVIPPPGLDAPLGSYIDPYGSPEEVAPVPSPPEPIAPSEVSSPTEYYQGNADPGKALVSSTPVATPEPVTPTTITVAPQITKPESVALAKATPKGGLMRRPPTPPPPPSDDGEDEEEGMLRMSFMDHLEELRTRILRALMGFVVAFFVSLTFTNPLWRFVSEPAIDALKHLGINPPRLVAITPMEMFSTIWIKMPLLVSIFIASPWLLYQIWAFISPGLYKRERRWAVPFILVTAGLFIAGGCFAYFVAFRYGLEFLLGIGRDINVTPMVSVTEYFDLFVNVTLGVAVVFEMPVVIFFLTLLRLASPRFLIRHSRYAILGIVILAAVITPTPDVFNMMLFAVPMCLLFFVGVLASYMLVMKREGKELPWGKIVLGLLGLVILTAAVVAVMVYFFQYHLINHWPFVTK
ncbi:MAG: twin-arginine translocase subunit TatC [Bryobacteraceae bacterium]